MRVGGCVCVGMYVCVGVYLCVCIYVRLGVYVCECVCVYMYVCMYCMYHIYFTAEMYVVVLYSDDVQLLHGIFLIYDQCIYSPENRYTNIFSLNTDEVQQRRTRF